MTYTLSYRSGRGEVWRWYWHAWRARLWKRHLLLAALGACLYTLLDTRSLDPLMLLSAFLAYFPGVVAVLALVSQLRFKGQQRTLIVGSHGWSTSIGGRTGSRPWDQVAAVRDTGNEVALVSANGNALVIPRRAFADAGQRTVFVRDVQAWQRAARP